jgi:hypothetical protein
MKETLKEIFKSAVLPNVVLASLLVFIHWVLISVWLLLNYDEHEAWKVALIGLLGGSLPAWIYGIWALRRFIIKGYRILHERVIKFWLKEFCDKIAAELVAKRELFKIEDSKAGIIVRFKEWITEKAANQHAVVKWLVRFVLRKIGYTPQLNERVQLARQGNANDISTLINGEIEELIIRASHRVIPGWIVYLIPMNTLLFLLLWFY